MLLCQSSVLNILCQKYVPVQVISEGTGDYTVVVPSSIIISAMSSCCQHPTTSQLVNNNNKTAQSTKHRQNAQNSRHKIILTKIKISLTEQFQFQNTTFLFLQVGADDAANRAKLCRFVFYAPNKAR